VSLRISNALVSYAKYLISIFWPTGLGVYYPFPPEGIPIWQVIAAVGLLGGITIWVIRRMRTRQYLFTGWLWYIGTLIPVIGLVQVGGQAMADRYSYIPSVGLFLMFVWLAGDLVAQLRIPIKVTAGVVFGFIAILTSLAVVQISFWRNSIALYLHTLLVSPNNVVVQYNLAHALGKQGDLNGAAARFQEALRLKPDFADALINIGVTLNQQGKFGEASGYLMRVLEVNPVSGKAHLELGIALAQTGKSDESLQQFYKALDLAPEDAVVRTNLGLLLARQQKLQEAGEQLTEAIRLNPNSPEAHNNLGLVMLMRGEPERSIPEFVTALRLNPDFRLAQENLNKARAQLKTKGE
jgi:protein O-mannosyl-transferase